MNNTGTKKDSITK